MAPLRYPGIESLDEFFPLQTEQSAIVFHQTNDAERKEFLMSA